MYNYIDLGITFAMIITFEINMKQHILYVCIKNVEISIKFKHLTWNILLFLASRVCLNFILIKGDITVVGLTVLGKLKEH